MQKVNPYCAQLIRTEHNIWIKNKSISLKMNACLCSKNELLSPVHTGESPETATIIGDDKVAVFGTIVASVDKALVLKRQAQAREMNNEFKAVSVTFESRGLNGNTCTFLRVTTYLCLMSTTKLDSTPCSFFSCTRLLWFKQWRYLPTFMLPFSSLSTWSVI